MKKIVCIILTIAILLSMSAVVLAASADVVQTGYNTEETTPPEEFTEPYIEPSSAPDFTEPPTEPYVEPTTSFTLPYEGYEYPDSDDRGECDSNANVYWDFYNDGRLIVHGVGYIDDEYRTNLYPWYKYHESIKSVLFEGVDNVPNHAFTGYPNLESVVIGDEVTSLGTNEYEYHGESTYTNAPETFAQCENLKSVSLGKNITFIDDAVFFGCNNLSEINLPDSLGRLGQSAFRNCTNLKLQSTNNISSIGAYAFQNCSSIENIEFKNEVDNIGKYAFSNCTSLQSVIFDDSLDRLGEYAFSDCTALAVISLPCDFENLTYSAIENTAFVNDENNWEDGILYIGNNVIKAKENISNVCYIKNGTKKILSYAFSGCEELESIVIPDSVSTIGIYAFNNCSGLKAVKFGKGITDVYDSAFNGCSNIEKVDIPSIALWCKIHFGYVLYSDWSNHRSFTCNPLYYGADLYVNGFLQTNIVISNVEAIDIYTFYNCKSLKTVIINGNVSEIGDYAFFGCSNLQEVKLKKNVSKIGEKTFWNCSKLKNIYIYNSNCNIRNAYETISGSATIYGYDDSTAQMYAGNYNRNFALIEIMPVILGDADGDGNLNIIDATCIQRHLAEIPVYEYIEEAADTDGDGQVTILDVTMIQRYLVQLPCPEGIGKPIK